MTKTNKHIEIVSSTIRGLSSMSKKSREAIRAVLAEHYEQVGITIVNNLSDLEGLVSRRPDLVFLGMKFIPLDPGLDLQDLNKIWLSGYFDEHGIAYTGSPQTAHELELNKPLAKQRALDAGLPTSPFYVAKQNEELTPEQITLTYPLFIKPTNRGAGLGIDSRSVVHNFDELKSKVQSIADDHGAGSLIEEYLPGREFSVAILKDESTADFVVMPIEKIASPDEHGRRVLSQQVKSSDAVRDLKVTDETLRTKITTLALDVFHALGARDYGRIDIRLDAQGVPQFLEANLIPSLIKGYGSFPKSCALNINLSYEAMLLRIVKMGLARAVDVNDAVFEAVTQNSALLPVLP